MDTPPRCAHNPHARQAALWRLGGQGARRASSAASPGAREAGRGLHVASTPTLLTASACSRPLGRLRAPRQPVFRMFRVRGGPCHPRRCTRVPRARDVDTPPRCAPTPLPAKLCSSNIAGQEARRVAQATQRSPVARAACCGFPVNTKAAHINLHARGKPSTMVFARPALETACKDATCGRI